MNSGVDTRNMLKVVAQNVSGALHPQVCVPTNKNEW